MKHVLICSLLVFLISFPVTIFAQDSDGEASPKPITKAELKENFNQLKALEGQLRELDKKVAGTVVAIQDGGGFGSGVIVSPEGLVLTVNHVTQEPGREINVILADGRKVKAKTLGGVTPVDAGMIQITEPGPYPFAEMNRNNSTRQGDWAVAYGHPLGYRPERRTVMRFGQVSKVDEAVIQTSCVIVPGDSGGPLFNLKGEVIGISRSINTQDTLANYHTPINIFLKYWDKIVAGEICRHTIWEQAKINKRCFEMAGVCAIENIVQIKQKDKWVAFGTIVDSNGWLVTKANCIDPDKKIICMVTSGKDEHAVSFKATEGKIIAVDDALDLALIKVDVKDLPVPDFDESFEPQVGTWVLSPSMMKDGELSGNGIVSIPSRDVPKEKAGLGYDFKKDCNGLVIDHTFPNSVAENAGVKANDKILKINGIEVSTEEQYEDEIKKLNVGEKVTLELERNGKIKTMKMPLAAWTNNKANIMTGISKRKSGYTNIIQHDSVIMPFECGGPLLNLDSKTIGINIARAGRVETYALPIKTVMGFVRKNIKE